MKKLLLISALLLASVENVSCHTKDFLLTTAERMELRCLQLLIFLNKLGIKVTNVPRLTYHTESPTDPDVKFYNYKPNEKEEVTNFAWEQENSRVVPQLTTIKGSQFFIFDIEDKISRQQPVGITEISDSRKNHLVGIICPSYDNSQLLKTLTSLEDKSKQPSAGPHLGPTSSLEDLEKSEREAFIEHLKQEQLYFDPRYAWWK